MQLRQSGEIISVPLVLVRPTWNKPVNMGLIPPTQEVVAFLIRLLFSATEEIEKVDEFDESILREQVVKLYQLRAARTLLTDQEYLKIVLASPSLQTSSTNSAARADCKQDARKIPVTLVITPHHRTHCIVKTLVI